MEADIPVKHGVVSGTATVGSEALGNTARGIKTGGLIGALTGMLALGLAGLAVGGLVAAPVLGLMALAGAAGATMLMTGGILAGSAALVSGFAGPVGGTASGLGVGGVFGAIKGLVMGVRTVNAERGAYDVAMGQVRAAAREGQRAAQNDMAQMQLEAMKLQSAPPSAEAAPNTTAPVMIDNNVYAPPTPAVEATAPAAETPDTGQTVAQGIIADREKNGKNDPIQDILSRGPGQSAGAAAGQVR